MGKWVQIVFPQLLKKKVRKHVQFFLSRKDMHDFNYSTLEHKNIDYILSQCFGRYRKRVLSARLSRHPSTIIAQIEIMMMEEQRMRDNSGDSWSLKSGIFSIPSASPSLQTLNEGDSHSNMLRKSDFRV